MLLIRLNAAAGPSRMAFPRTFHAAASVTRSLHASSRPSVLAPSSTFAAHTATRGLWSRAVSFSPRAPNTHMSEEKWPWYRVEPPLHKGKVELERVIYARPREGSGQMLWGSMILIGASVVVYFTMPSIDNVRKIAGKEDEPAVPNSLIWTFLTKGFIYVVPLCGIGFLYLISRQYFLRMNTVLKDSLGPLGKPRELSLDEVKVNLILDPPTRKGERARSTWLKMSIGNKEQRLSTRRLDFSPQKVTDDTKEFVLSVQRVEDVFGHLKPTWGEVDVVPGAHQTKKRSKK